MPHVTRAFHRRREPVHVTLRRADLLPSLREQGLFLAMRSALARTVRSWFRVVEFSFQTNHVHLIVEADDQRSLSRGMTGLCVRLARALNRALGRHGAVWNDRFHARALKTPREMRNVLVYVLFNRNKHARPVGDASVHRLDPCSSAWWFSGWAHPPLVGPPFSSVAPPVAPAQTWVAREGWKHYGLLRLDESPARDR
jgi:REP element-mobilizing transposase RayT